MAHPQRPQQAEHWQNVELPLFPVDNERMILTDREREVAFLIKGAAQALPEVEPLSDFMYAQYAIVALQQGDVNALGILARIQGLLHYREEFQVLNTMEDGRRLISRNILDLIPGFHLAFVFCPEAKVFVHVTDMTKFDASILTNSEKTREWMAGEYYFRHAAYPDFAAIREGLIQLVECQGYEWRNPNMLNITAMRKIASEFGAYYPINFLGLKFYHTGMFVNLAMSAAKKLVPRMLHKSFEMGCQFEYGRLDEIILIPTKEAATRRVLAAFHTSLKTRYDNEASFSLEGGLTGLNSE